MHGRPTLYKPQFCDEVIALGKLGYCCYRIAKAFGVSRRTLYDWTKQHPEWKIAFQLARDYTKAWLSEKMVDNLDNKNFQGRMMEFVVRFVAFPVEYDSAQIPGLAEAKTIKEQSDAVIAALGNQIISAKQASDTMDVILKAATAIERTDTQERVDALEALLKK